VPGNDLKHRFLYLIQVAFCVDQEVEKVFKLTCEPLKVRFLGLTQVEIWAAQEEENVFAVP